MRIRQVKPAFWTDKVMASLPKSARLTYVGLWMLADDSGWIEWDIDTAGAELFPYEPVRRRLRELTADLEALMDAGRIARYDCGCIQVPHLEEHQRISGVRSFRARDAHAKHLPLSTTQEPLSTTQEPLSDSPGTVGNGRVGNGRERNGSARDGQDEAPKEDEQSDGRPDLDAFVAVRRRIPTPPQRAFMDAYCQTFDQTGPERAARLIWGHPDDPIGAMKVDLQGFREERRAEALASEVPKAPRRRKPSGFTGVNAEIAKALAGVDAKRGENGMAPLSELLPEAFAASRGGKPT